MDFLRDFCFNKFFYRFLLSIIFFEKLSIFFFAEKYTLISFIFLFSVARVAPHDSFELYMSKIYKYMTSISQNVYIDKVVDIFHEKNNRYYRTIKMKPAEVN